jgi:hypothetical protein
MEEYMAGVKTEIDVAWMCFEDSSIFDKWKEDNPGEYEKIDNYRKSDSQEPDGIESKFGFGLLAMVNAGKLGDGTYQL